jgi:hypothetical protein
MKARISKILIAVFGLSLAIAPLTASAQGYAVRGGYVARGGAWNHGFVGDRFHAGFRGGYRAGFAAPVRFGSVGYARTYVNGYYGAAPSGFVGFYWNGGWYPHRRWHDGIWVYF